MTTYNSAKYGNVEAGGVENKLINGDFSVAQRNMGAAITSTTSFNNNDTAYTLDRWKLFSDGNDRVDISQETSTVPTNQLHAIKLDVEGTNVKFGIAQCVENENCVGLIGQQCTLSFKAKVSDTSKLDNIKAAIIAWNGTADAPTDDMISDWENEGTDPSLVSNFTYENTPSNLGLTTSYATYSVTATIDTSSTTNVIAFIWSDVKDTTAGHHLFITDVMLVAGTSTTYPRIKRDDQIRNCKRYFQLFKGDQNGARFLGFAGDNADAGIILNPPMAKTPSVTNSSPTFRHGDSTADRAVGDVQIRSQFFDVNGDFYTLRISSTDGFSGGSCNMRFANSAHFTALDGEIW